MLLAVEIGWLLLLIVERRLFGRSNFCSSNDLGRIATSGF
jgi:hypothetical protein